MKENTNANADKAMAALMRRIAKREAKLPPLTPPLPVAPAPAVRKQFRRNYSPSATVYRHFDGTVIKTISAPPGMCWDIYK